jgi:DNA-binding cell septation regulator SpoVG
MSQIQLTSIEQEVRRISEILLLNGTLVDCPGVIHGKMGIAIFFSHYARYTQNPLFKDYVFYLIEEIQKQIHANTSADYERGIAGIGVGIDYLTRHSFLNVADDIFDDFDQRMYRAVMYDPWTDFSLYDGLVGYGRFWIARQRARLLNTSE